MSYADRAQARRAGRLVQHAVGHSLHPYRCRDCRGYHLTSQRG